MKGHRIIIYREVVGATQSKRLFLEVGIAHLVCTDIGEILGGIVVTCVSRLTKRITEGEIEKIVLVVVLIK